MKKRLYLRAILLLGLLTFGCADADEGNTLISISGNESIDGIVLFAESNSPRTGNLGGRSGIDALCMASVNKPSGVSIVMGFLSAEMSEYALSTFPTNYGFSNSKPIKSLNKSTIATNWADLMNTGTMTQSLADFGVLPGGTSWWSGIMSSGSPGSSGETCMMFTDDSSGWGSFGMASGTGLSWWFNAADACSQTRYILCVAE